MHISKLLPGVETSDGAGVRLTRMIGTAQLDMIDPFLMLDRFDNDDPGAYIGGFPEHPHRGFETVTIMLDGKMRHRDSTGGEGIVGPGDVQWMTAGRGIVHSEMPEQIEGRMRGFQLWVNLPASNKMKAPGYQDVLADDIPGVKEDGATINVIAGRYDTAEGPAQSHTPIRLLRVDLEPGAAWSIDATEGHNAFFCIYDGTVTGSGTNNRETTATAPSLAVLDGKGPTDLVAGPQGASLFFAEGEPIGEPVARHGPFVMNAHEELVQAFNDYRRGLFGT